MGTLEQENGKNIYFEDYGSGDSAVILIHGWGMGLRAWDYSLEALRAAGHRVVALDHRGCGASDKDFASLGIDDIAGDVASLVGHLGIDRCVLNGWSLGGAVAVAAARELADSCAGVVLTCGATPCYLQKPDYPHGGTEDALAGTLEALAADRVNFLWGLSQGICATEVGETVERWLWQMFMAASPLAARSLAELGPLDQRDTLRALECPVLSVVGGQDAVVDPAVCRSVADYARNARLVEFDEAGHAPFIDCPAAYNDALLGFLAETL